jgi:hypothetical protein
MGLALLEFAKELDSEDMRSELREEEWWYL